MSFLLFLFAMYWLPTIVAILRHTHSALGVAVVNFFTGWTVVGWVVAMLWALGAAPGERVVYVERRY